MNITTLPFKQVLQEFYLQDKYEFMLLFVSSSDVKDKDICGRIVDNAWRIDRIMGERICFHYTIQHELSDDICSYFRMSCYDLPAFILVSKDKHEEPQIFSAYRFSDFFNSLEILCYYVDESGSCEHVFFRDLEYIDAVFSDKLNEITCSCYGEFLIEDMHHKHSYSFAVLKIWDLIKNRHIRASYEVVQKKVEELYMQKYDVFILCQSQKYIEALKFCIYLREHGFKPFVAYRSLKEMRSTDYQEIVKRLLERCPNIIFFHGDFFGRFGPRSCDIDFIYHNCKRNARIVNVRSQDMHIHEFPKWIKGEWFLIKDIYSKDLLRYLNSPDSHSNRIGVIQVRDEVEEVFSYYKCKLDRMHSCKSQYVEYVISDEINYLERDKFEMLHTLNECQFSYESIDLEHYAFEMKRILEKWEHECNRLEKEIRIKEYECEFERQSQYKENLKGSSQNVSLEPNNFVGKESGKTEIDLHKSEYVSYSPLCPNDNSSKSNSFISFWDKLFNRKTYDVFSSIFAPAEVKRNSHMLVQLYLHLLEDTETVKLFAKESQKEAVRRDYIPLQCKLKKGDKVDVLLNIYGESLLMEDKKSVVWQGSVAKCTFDYYIPNNIEVNQLSCKAFLSVNRIPVGEMNFITEIVQEKPSPFNPKIIARKYKKVFISYAHKDEPNVKFLAKGFELMKVDHFFDRKYLQAGDIFPQVIEDYINSADLFILCWSKNAAQSDYVKKEYTQALGRVNPQVNSQEDDNLSIRPISIEPKAELPDAMKDNYHFGEV